MSDEKKDYLKKWGKHHVDKSVGQAANDQRTLAGIEAIICDERLSYAARGMFLWMYVTSQPLSIDAHRVRFGEAIEELEKLGYIQDAGPHKWLLDPNAARIKKGEDNDD